jgi:2-oxoglutarate dehydrogenase E1 component
MQLFDSYLMFMLGWFCVLLIKFVSCSSGRKDVAIIRVEELSPFPFQRTKAEIEKYSNAKLIWCQEGIIACLFVLLFFFFV